MYKSKTKQNSMDYNFMSKNGMCTGKNKKSKVKIHRKSNNITVSNTLFKLLKLCLVLDK